MRATFNLSLPLLLSATAASAHTGHVGELAGHDHWVAGAAIGTAVVIGAWAFLKGRRKTEADRARTEEDAAAEDAQDA